MFSKIFLRAFIGIFLCHVPLAAAALSLHDCVFQTPQEKKLKDYIQESLQGKNKYGFLDFDLSTTSSLSDRPLESVSNAQAIAHALKQKSHVLTLLVEFDDPQGQGPLHNRIPEPAGNAYYWKEDFSPAHYQKILFGRHPEERSLANYYKEVSSGRYRVSGDVFGWYKVPKPELLYGQNITMRPSDRDRLYGPPWRIISDVRTATGDEIDWKKYDQIDRYDWDQDGDFNEPDGYIDHLMIVHAGVGEEIGGGAQYSNAIWSHRGRANFSPPESALTDGPQKYRARGGIQMSAQQDIWALDYVMAAENSAPGIFAHEFGHDLGLPDLYDKNPKQGSHASVAFWSIMATGSWAALENEAPGSMPTHLSPWGKLKLSWLDYNEISLQDKDIKQYVLLDRSEFHGRKAQALKINLPDQYKTVPVFDPVDGEVFAYSQKGDDLLHQMRTEIDLSQAAKATLRFKAYYDIEPEYDYAAVEIQNEEGLWFAIPGNITSEHSGITGGSHGWVDAEFDLTPYVGAKRGLRFRYVTDISVGGKGLAIDRIEIPEIHFKEDFENGPGDWIYSGFRTIKQGKYDKAYPHYYLMEWRTHYGYDSALKSVRYQTPAMGTSFYAYQPGLLMWYRNGAYEEGDNDVGSHVGEGALLVVDAHPEPAKILWDPAFQLYDAAFHLYPSAPFYLFKTIPLAGAAAVTSFHDRLNYYDERIPYNSVKLPPYGLRFAIDQLSDDQSAAQVLVEYNTRQEF